MRSKKVIGTSLSMMKKIALAIGFGIALIAIWIGVVIGYYFVTNYIAYHKYSRNIDRITDNEIEENLLEIAENLDYSSLLNQSRFVGRETFCLNKDHCYANYIDKEGIQYYWDRIGYLEKKREWGKYWMSYKSNIDYVNRVHIKMYESETMVFSEYTFLIETEQSTYSDGLFFEESIRVAIYDGSDFKLINGYESLDLSFSNCYLVEMNLSYGRQTGGEAGDGFWINQYVIFDKDGNLLMIYKYRTEWIS